MSINWNLYLARYQQDRGGSFFGAAEDDCDAQLVLIEGEKSPLSVCFGSAPAGRYTTFTLKARTMVRLTGTYELNIRPRSLLGGGVQQAAGMVGRAMDFGYPEATKGRIITTSDPRFTKLVLGDLALRNALTARSKECLTVRPAPQKDGWHLVELDAPGFDGGLSYRSPWISDAMAQELPFYAEDADRDVILRAGSEHFNTQMDGFLDFLRAARDAVTMWPM